MSLYLIFCVCESIRLAPTFSQLILLYFFNCSWHSVPFHSSFRGTGSWLGNYIHDKVSPLIPTWHCAQSSGPCDYFVTTNLHFFFRSPFSLRPPRPHPTGDHQSVPCIYRSASVLVGCSFCPFPRCMSEVITACTFSCVMRSC